MKKNSIIMLLAAASLLVAGCAPAAKTSANTQANTSSKAPAKASTTLETTPQFPAVSQQGKVAIVAHRGFWNCEAGGKSENSIASLKAAQDAGVWGSECDVHITADDVVIVNHDGSIGGKDIASHKFSDFANDLLPNGEHRPTIDEYLTQAAKCPSTKLIIELKPQRTEAREDALVGKVIAALKAHGMYDPQKVLFISFSQHICEKVAAEHPKFVNQFLSSNFVKNETPKAYAKKGINGVDYHYKMFAINPDYVTTAHELGMSVNAWTVDKEADIKDMIKLGVDAITSNEPLRVRELLGDKEYKNE